MSLGPFQILIIALVILVFFGRGRISEMMGDFGKGVNSFKKGIQDVDAADPHRIAAAEGDPVAEARAAESKIL